MYSELVGELVWLHSSVPAGSDDSACFAPLMSVPRPSPCFAKMTSSVLSERPVTREELDARLNNEQAALLLASMGQHIFGCLDCSRLVGTWCMLLYILALFSKKPNLKLPMLMLMPQERSGNFAEEGKG